MGAKPGNQPGNSVPEANSRTGRAFNPALPKAGKRAGAAFHFTLDLKPLLQIYALKSKLFNAGSSAEKLVFPADSAATRRIGLTADVY
jgi:hypothetical protein